LNTKLAFVKSTGCVERHLIEDHCAAAIGQKHGDGVVGVSVRVGRVRRWGRIEGSARVGGTEQQLPSLAGSQICRYQIPKVGPTLTDTNLCRPVGSGSSLEIWISAESTEWAGVGEDQYGQLVTETSTTLTNGGL
jgi:hypothetical protein